MPINSKQKGSRGERLWRDECNKVGFTESRRTQQYCGGTIDSSDVVGIPDIHQEVKVVEKLNIQTAMDQSINDTKKSKKDEIPIVAHKRNRKPWMVTMLADDWFDFLKAWLKERGKLDAEHGFTESSGENES